MRRLCAATQRLRCTPPATSSCPSQQPRTPPPSAFAPPPPPAPARRLARPSPIPTRRNAQPGEKSARSVRNSTRSWRATTSPAKPRPRPAQRCSARRRRRFRRRWRRQPPWKPHGAARRPTTLLRLGAFSALWACRGPWLRARLRSRRCATPCPRPPASTSSVQWCVIAQLLRECLLWAPLLCFASAPPSFSAPFSELGALTLRSRRPHCAQAAASLLHAMSEDAEASVAAALEVNASPAEAASTNPVMELLQGGHEQLYARLFQS